MGVMKASRAGAAATEGSRDDPLRKLKQEIINSADREGRESGLNSKAVQRIADARESESKGASAPVLALPDDVMLRVLALLPRQSLVMARAVCSSWKRLAEQQELASLRRKVPPFSHQFLQSFLCAKLNQEILHFCEHLVTLCIVKHSILYFTADDAL